MRRCGLRVLRGHYRNIEGAYTKYADKVQCFIFTFLDGNLLEISHTEKKSELPIRSVAMSPKDELIAFLHKHDRQGRKTLGVTLNHTQDIIDQSTSR